VTAQSLTVLHSFSGPDGSNPISGLVQGADGNFYGTTYGGGTANGTGTVFKMTPSGTFTTLAYFTSATGAGPVGLVEGNDGNFYSTTYVGGSTNSGTIFKITPAGTLTTLYTFAAFSEPSTEGPTGLVMGIDGNFYGTTVGSVYAGGSSSLYPILFKITPSGAFTTLISNSAVTFGTPLALGPNGTFLSSNTSNIEAVTLAGSVTNFSGVINISIGVSGPGEFVAPVLVLGSDGYVYCSDEGNESEHILGGIYKMSSTGVPTKLVSFAGMGITSSGDSALGACPLGALVQGADGNFYGVTDGAANPSAYGTVFEMTPSGTLKTVALSSTAGIVFLGGAGGFAYHLIQGSDGSFYGTSYYGGVNGDGTIFKFTPPADVVTQPAAQSVLAPTAALFSVPTALNALYQWRVSTDGGNSWSNVANSAPYSGATTNILSITPTAIGLNGAQYCCIVSTTSGIQTSDPGVLTVTTNAPVITHSAVSQTISSGGIAVFNTTVTGSPSPAYQWTLNGSTTIPGASVTNSPSLVVNGATIADQGTITCTAINSSGSAATSATLTVAATTNPGRLINLSSRAYVGTGGNTIIAGFGIGGTGSKNLLLRGVGPGLAATFPTLFTTASVLANPQLTLYDSTSTPVVTDNGWGNAFTLGTSSTHVSPQAGTATLMNTVGAFALTTGSPDSALEVTPAIGSYTSQVSGANSTSGIALVEIYDADTGTPTALLDNLSTRADVGLGGNSLIGGFIIAGTTSETVLIRGVGPGLAATFPTLFTAASVLANPQLILYDSSGAQIATSIGWGNSPTLGDSSAAAGVVPATAAIFSQLGAFSLGSGSADCAMVVTLPPGDYTAQVSGVGSTIGIALVEVYEVP